MLGACLLLCIFEFLSLISFDPPLFSITSGLYWFWSLNLHGSLVWVRIGPPSEVVNALSYVFCGLYLHFGHVLAQVLGACLLLCIFKFLSLISCDTFDRAIIWHCQWPFLVLIIVSSWFFSLSEGWPSIWGGQCSLSVTPPIWSYVFAALICILDILCTCFIRFEYPLAFNGCFEHVMIGVSPFTASLFMLLWGLTQALAHSVGGPLPLDPWAVCLFFLSFQWIWVDHVGVGLFLSLGLWCNLRFSVGWVLGVVGSLGVHVGWIPTFGGSNLHHLHSPYTKSLRWGGDRGNRRLIAKHNILFHPVHRSSGAQKY